MTTTYYTATGISGGGADDLDFIDGVNLADGDRAFVTDDNKSYLYILDYYSGEDEDAPYIIEPDTNADDKRWILQPPATVRMYSKTQAASPVTLTAALVDGITILANTGATAEVVFNLPAGADGMRFRAEVVAAYYVRLVADGTETIQYAGISTAAGGYVRSATAGSYIEGHWNGVGWTVTAIIGPWQYDQ